MPKKKRAVKAKWPWLQSDGVPNADTARGAPVRVWIDMYPIEPDRVNVILHGELQYMFQESIFAVDRILQGVLRQMGFNATVQMCDPESDDE